MPLTVADNYDAELRRLNARFRAATDIRGTDCVLDIGCGAGQTSREAARAAVAGRVLGVDSSEHSLERARERTAAEALHNVTYELGDAQVHPFVPGQFDVVISRFGTMFFANPVAAFSNIARAARPEARLVMLVWQSQDRNEWAIAIDAALNHGKPTPAPAYSANPFSLAQLGEVESILEAAGFSDIGFEDVHEPVFYGPDAESAYEIVSSMSMMRDVLSWLDPSEARAARSRLRQLLASHETNEGVAFDSRAWLVIARRFESEQPTSRSCRRRANRAGQATGRGELFLFHAECGPGARPPSTNTAAAISPITSSTALASRPASSRRPECDPTSIRRLEVSGETVPMPIPTSCPTPTAALASRTRAALAVGQALPGTWPHNAVVRRATRRTRRAICARSSASPS